MHLKVIEQCDFNCFDFQMRTRPQASGVPQIITDNRFETLCGIKLNIELILFITRYARLERVM
jgi:hypothetical protein